MNIHSLVLNAQITIILGGMHALDEKILSCMYNIVYYVHFYLQKLCLNYVHDDMKLFLC